jgi:hypothetical protein
MLHFGSADSSDIFGLVREWMEFRGWVFEEFETLGAGCPPENGRPASNHLNPGVDMENRRSIEVIGFNFFRNISRFLNHDHIHMIPGANKRDGSPVLSHRALRTEADLVF